MIYYTINKILGQDEDGWITSEQIVYDDDGRTITFPDLETAESYYEQTMPNVSVNPFHIAIHKAEDDDAWKWATERFLVRRYRKRS